MNSHFYAYKVTVSQKIWALKRSVLFQGNKKKIKNPLEMPKFMNQFSENSGNA